MQWRVGSIWNNAEGEKSTGSTNIKWGDVLNDTAKTKFDYNETG